MFDSASSRRSSARSRRVIRSVSLVGGSALVASLLAGCGSSSGNSKNTLVIAEWTNAAAVTYTQQLDKVFEQQHPGVTVKLETAPTANAGWPTLAKSLLAAKSVDLLAEFPPTPAGFPPSYTGIKPAFPAALVTSHQLLDLKNQPFMKDYNPTTAAYAAGYQNGIYGVPAAEYVNNSGMWYKKSLLDKYHMSVPATFDQFMNDIRVLKSKGVTPVFVAGKDGYQNILFAGIYNQLIMRGTPASQATAVDLNNAQQFWKGTRTWQSSVFQTAVNRYEQVMRYIEPAAAGVPAQTAPGVWASQADNYPFFIDGSYDGDTITQASPGLQVGFFAFPGTDNQAWNRTPIAADLTWTVPTWAKHQKLALEWLSLFSQKSNYEKWVRVTGSLSTQTGVSTPKLSWTSWLSSHASDSYPALTPPWAPDGAPTDAAEPDTIAMQPIGSVSPSTELKDANRDYTNAIKNSR